MQRFTKKDVIIVVLFFVFYMLVYAWLIEPKKSQSKSTEKKVLLESPMSVSDKEPQKAVKSLEENWSLDLGRYYYTIDIDPGNEMEDEVYEVVGKLGDKLLVERHNDWPDISGHFEWYCNERLTTTQQMYDYVVSHRKAILRQMQEVRNRGISSDFDEASYFQDHYDEYLDDPEDEIRFPPEIFDANED
jgi:hypothetical protein